MVVTGSMALQDLSIMFDLLQSAHAPGPGDPSRRDRPHPRKWIRQKREYWPPAIWLSARIHMAG
jgi:hypothetical protein